MKHFASLLIFLLIASVPAFAQSQSFKSLLEKAKQGGVNAQNEVGIAYSEGRGVRRNQQKAVYWFAKSAENGYAIGICNLGLHYGWGLGVPRNLTVMMKYVFAAHAIDGLKCNPADFIEYFKPRPSECQIAKGWQLAVAWLRAHPDFDNSFGERPWAKDDDSYPVTVRENAPSVRLPFKNKCTTRRPIKNISRKQTKPLH